ncbi:MAG TPA: hypothetical protein VLT36_17140, partial [Candidatus Dormibacteraeota bacterium]|nr:hypothetical protein [Candidatus Dormibacteraeota bacterium]
NYMELDLYSQQTLDKMSKEIRQAQQLISFSSNSISFSDINTNTVQLTYDPTAGTLNRIIGGATNVYLTGCDSLQFSIYQHTPMSNSFDCYDPAYVTNAKLLQVSWVCSRKILGAKVNTESVQSAKIALRND